MEGHKWNPTTGQWEVVEVETPSPRQQVSDSFAANTGSAEQPTVYKRLKDLLNL